MSATPTVCTTADCDRPPTHWVPIEDTGMHRYCYECALTLTGDGDSDDERRAAFLGGEGTLTVAEVWAWALELGFSGAAPLLPDDEPLMVRVLPEDHARSEDPPADTTAGVNSLRGNESRPA